MKAGSGPQSSTRSVSRHLHIQTVPISSFRRGRLTVVHSMASFVVPISVLTDSYKATHFLQYPGATKMVAVGGAGGCIAHLGCPSSSPHHMRFSRPQYGEFRVGYQKDQEDTRIVSYGIRYIIDNYISKQWTLEDVERADLFYK